MSGGHGNRLDGRARWWVAVAGLVAVLLIVATSAGLAGGAGRADGAAGVAGELGAAGGGAAEVLEAPKVGGPCAAPQPRPEVVTEEQIRRVWEGIQESERVLEETGWLWAKGESMVEPGVWICGWVQPFGTTFEDAYALIRDAQITPTEVFDVPDGELIAYGYGVAGALPVDAPEGFDVEAAIIEANGCLSLFPCRDSRD